ncbi:hypothetical protein FORC13_p128 (plasmid) [Bacillus cereus]|nr:hypothetical protein FORC13_p128 [Bacillus cereus]
MKIRYTRVSTHDQNLAMHVDVSIKKKYPVPNRIEKN